jgi:hypothetical protein
MIRQYYRVQYFAASGRYSLPTIYKCNQIEIWSTHMCHIRPCVDPITFSKPSREYVYLTGIRNVNSNKLSAFATPSTAGSSRTSLASVCIILSGRGSWRILNPDRDVLLPSNFRYERRIGYSLKYRMWVDHILDISTNYWNQKINYWKIIEVMCKRSKSEIKLTIIKHL